MEYSFFVTNVVKHIIKSEKRACSTLEAGKNKPIFNITKTREFKRKKRANHTEVHYAHINAIKRQKRRLIYKYRLQ